MIETNTLTLTEAADVLGMNKTNVAGFLKRREIEPVTEGPKGRLWLRAAVERARDEYEASGRRKADKLRSDVMKGKRPPRERKANPTRTGPTQKLYLLKLAGYEVEELPYNKMRSTRQRLYERGLITAADESAELTAAGKEVADTIAAEENTGGE